MAKQNQKQTPEEFLAHFPPEVQDLAQRLRLLVRETLPEAREAVYAGWQLIGYRVPHGRRDAYVGFIAPKEDHVALGFEYGVLLADPDGLLQGDGSQVRVVHITQAQEIRPQPLAALIRAAAAVAMLSKEEKAQLFLQRDAARDAAAPVGRATAPTSARR